MTTWEIIQKAARTHIRPPDARTPWEWCEQHLVVDRTSAFAANQKWKSDISPWVREVMEAFADPIVTELSCRTSAQSAKTQSMIGLACWVIAEDPGPMLWVTASRDDVRTFASERLIPTFENCKPVAILLPKNRSVTSVGFASMPFEIVGAGSPSKLQSRPIRYLLLDEVRNYPAGALQMVQKRTRTYWNSKTVIISTADRKNDAVDTAFLSGDQRKWFFPCPCCGHEQTIKWERMRWGDPDDKTHGAYRSPSGVWDFDKLAPTIRYECEACDHQIADTPQNRAHIIHKGRWIRTNPHAPKHRVSFTWSALLPSWVKWRQVVEEFLMAMSALRHGDREPLKTFINETLGESWSDDLGHIQDFDGLKERKRPYYLGEVWPDEKRRFFAADRQAKDGDHFFWVCRSISVTGEDRLVGYGKIEQGGDLEERLAAKAEELKVRPGDCMVDCGYKFAETVRFCSRMGWKAFKGDDREWYPGKDRRTGKPVRTIWTKGEADPAIGTEMQGRMRPIPLFIWSNPTAKDMLAMWMGGKSGNWTLPQDVGDDYLKQITAEHRIEETDAKGRKSYRWSKIRNDDHYRDCELMILVAKTINRLGTNPEHAAVHAGLHAEQPNAEHLN